MRAEQQSIRHYDMNDLYKIEGEVEAIHERNQLCLTLLLVVKEHDEQRDNGAGNDPRSWLHSLPLLNVV